MKVQVEVVVDGVEYAAVVESGKVVVAAGGMWAGSGRWNGDHIEDCGAELGDSVYEALDAALREAGASPAARCECGEWSGEWCPWSGDANELVKVTFVPNWQRGTAEAAGTWSGLTTTIRVHPKCADFMEEVDGEWVQ